MKDIMEAKLSLIKYIPCVICQNTKGCVMKNKSSYFFTAFLLISVPTSVIAVNFQRYSSSMPAYSADELSRTTLLGILGSCGNTSNLDDNCVVQNLERVATEENNSEAKSLLADYEAALHEGRGDQPECQTEDHMQVNRIIGHCVLLLNYYALDTNDKEAAIAQFGTCLQGGMIGLAYQGNLAAQLVLSDIFNEKGLSDQASLWRNSAKTRKNTEDYQLMVRCYGG